MLEQGTSDADKKAAVRAAGTTTTTTAPAAPTGPGDSAKAILLNFLNQYGLGALGDWAWAKMLNGETIDQISLEMRDRPEYQTRFPAMAELAKQGRAMSEDQYMAMEDSYRGILHSYGLPTGFYDQPQDFAKMMVGNVSPAELNDRVKTYQSAVLGDTETLTQLRTLYDSYGHANDAQGDLLAHYIDPNTAAPLLTEQLQAAQFAAGSKRAGFGQLSAAEAEQFGARRDISEQQAEQGFGALVQNRELMQGLPGEGQGGISREEQLGAAFSNDVRAQEKIQNRARLRVAETQNGGQFSSSRTGISGLGTSQV